MAIHKITKSYVDKQSCTTEKSKQEFHYDTELKGFGLRIGNKAKTYIAEAKVNGKTVRVTIGQHGRLTPDEARNIAKEKLALMSRDINPNAIDRENRLKLITLKEVYEDYMLARKSLKPTTKRDYKTCAEKYLKEWLNKPMLDITRDMMEQKHSELTNTSAAQANLAMRFLRALFNFAAEYRDSKGHIIIADNPVRRLSAKKIWNRIKLRTNYIQIHQLKDWWDAVWLPKRNPRNQATQSSEIIRDYLLLLLFTGLRREEALTLTFDSIDFKAKTPTIKDTKNRMDHTLPLSDFLFDLLKRREAMKINNLVFPGTGKYGRIIEPRKQIIKIVEISKVDFTPHALRRTFASIVNMLGDKISYYTVKRLLNHKSSDVTAGYVQYDIEKLREAMQAVTNYILKHVNANNTT